MSEDKFTINVEQVDRETDKACLLVVDGQPIWMPKSQILGAVAVGEVEITKWIAEQKGLTGKEPEVGVARPDQSKMNFDDVPF